MKFKARASTGKAGEYYLAYWITKNFHWPCRLLDIDVGIDAQIEIFDELNHSVGDFIAVQIKATEKEDPSVSIKLNNLEYWGSIEDPVILISISMSEETPKIYWKQINDKRLLRYIADAKKNKSKTTSVNFIHSDLLNLDSKEVIAKLPYKDRIKIINKAITEAHENCEKINDSFWCAKNESYSYDHIKNFDYLSIDHYIYLFENACQRKDEINDIIKEMPKIKNLTTGISEVEKSFDLASDNIYQLIGWVSEIDGDHDYERSKFWMTSESHKIVVKMFEDTHDYI
jgi:hypothetical protein